MRLKIVIVLVMIFSITANILYSQKFREFTNEETPECITENIVLFTDRDIYISGEDIWFSSYCYINELLTNKTLSNILYIEVYNNKKSILKRKFKIQDGIAYGSLKIPEETLSGNYYIRAYTQYLRNFSPEQFFTSFITIINPEIPLTAITKNTTDTIVNNSLSEKNEFNSEENNIHGINHNYKLSSKALNIDLKVVKEKYSPRELVNITLNHDFINPQDFAFLTISVIKHGTFRDADTIIPQYLIDNPQLLNSYLLSSESNHDLFASSKTIPKSLYNRIINTENIRTNSKYQDYKKLAWIPENRDITISGIVYDKDSKKPLSNQQIFASVLGNSPQFHINSTREKGEFIFSLDHLFDMKGILISMRQWKDLKPEYLINNDFSANFAALKNIPLNTDSTQRKLLEEMFVNYQITKLFNNKKDSGQNKQFYSPISFGDIEISIVLADFIELPTFTDVIREIVPYTRLNKKDGRYNLILTNSITVELYRDPLILLDNIPVFDVNELIKINPKKIIKIEVINKPYVYGDYTLNGVIRIVTNTDNFADYDFSGESVYIDYQTITSSAKPVFTDYNSEGKKNNRIPDFRNMLYWKPDLFLSNQDINLSFYTSDACSKYDIIVKGISNKGKACFGKTSIEVLRKKLRLNASNNYRLILTEVDENKKY